MGNILRKLQEVTDRSWLAVSTNGHKNPFLIEHDEDNKDYNGHVELENLINSIEGTLSIFKKDETGAQKPLTQHEKQLMQHAATLANNVRKYANETSQFLDKTLSTDALKTALQSADALLIALNKDPEDYDVSLIDNHIKECWLASNSLNKDIHKYNFKASLLMIAAIAVTILAIALLTTLTGIFIPISIIGITLTAELISKVVVAACFTSAIGFSLTGTWLFTRKNDIAISFEKVSTDAKAILSAAPAA